MLVFSNIVANYIISTQQETAQEQEAGYALDTDTYPGALTTLEDGPQAPEVDTYEPNGEELAGVEQEYITQDCRQDGDRKSTRLNSSHVAISYAVFCLKKKK